MWSVLLSPAHITVMSVCTTLSCPAESEPWKNIHTCLPATQKTSKMICRKSSSMKIFFNLPNHLSLIPKIRADTTPGLALKLIPLTKSFVKYPVYLDWLWKKILFTKKTCPYFSVLFASKCKADGWFRTASQKILSNRVWREQYYQM